MTDLEKELQHLGFTIEVILHDESEHPKGFFASGDEDADRAQVAAILADLDAGNDWAWCCVEVRVSYGELSSSEYLGCCSYGSREDFEADGYSDMLSEALDRLRENCVWTLAAARKARRALRALGRVDG